MSEALHEEFDTVAEWTAQVAVELGRDSYLPAGCKGSGGQAALRWLLDELQVTDTDRMLDCGAGIGGPAAFAAERTGTRPVLIEPEPGACRAAARLFGLPIVRASAQALPFGDSSFDVAWCLAVLCTTDDQLGLLRELRRVLEPTGRIGLLVYVRTSAELPDPPAGNTFPDERELTAMIATAGLHVTARRIGSQFPDDDAEWTQQSDAVDAALRTRHGNDRGWQTAEAQSAAFGRLLDDGQLNAVAMVLRRTGSTD